MWKMLTVQIRENIYYLLISRELFREEQKGCHKETKEQESYCILINTPSKREKWDAKI